MHKPKRDPFRVVVDDECRHNSEEKTVVDERCFCGHLKSEHLGTMNASLGHMGCYLNCSVCSCKKFIWWAWVFDDGTEA